MPVMLLHVTYSKIDKKASFKAKYTKVFKSLGKLKDLQLKLHIDPAVQPVAQPLCRIPFGGRQKIIEKLEQLEALGVMEKVESPRSWVNPLVAVEKLNSDIRLCLDLSPANQATLRESHPIPTIQETLLEISNAKVFTKLDLDMYFHHIELGPEFLDITTVPALGMHMAIEKFQNLIWQVQKDCPGTHNLHDDTLVVGEDKEEHDKNLNRALGKQGKWFDAQLQ